VLGSFLFWFEAVRRVFDLEIINASKTPLLAAWAERFVGTVEAKEVVPLPTADMAVQYINKLHAPLPPP
jgi:glutathione S-transferase